MEPKKPVQALKDPSWVEAMQDELLQFKLLNVWTLVDLPRDKWAIGTKWVFRNKKDERGIVVKKQAILVAQGHTQEEGIDYDEVFAPVARIEAIRLFLAYASFKDFVVYQMDVKSAFLYGKIEEEVYVCQPPGFEDPHFLDKVYKVEKALYGLHQAPRAWYETLSTYLLDNGFHKGQIDKTLFIKRHKDDILLVQVYVDDIIFGSTKKQMSNEFETLMHDKFQMSSMGELSFFLGLQVKQKSDGIFISQDKYVAEILKKFDFTSVKTTSTPMETNKAFIKDKEAKDVDVHLYRSMIRSLMYLTASKPNIMFVVCACARFQITPKTSYFNAVKRIFSDYAGASLDKKSTTGGCQFLGKRLISWQCKKQTIVANSTTEAEYVAAANCCGQVLWIQNQMLDFGFNFMNTKIYIDNESTICIVKNPVFHSKTKHIEIRHHFIRDSYEKKLIQVIKIHTDQNVVDLLTKAFDVSRQSQPSKCFGNGEGLPTWHLYNWDGLVGWMMECCRVEVWEQNRVLAGFGIGGKFGKKGYTSWVDRGRLKMIKGMFDTVMSDSEDSTVTYTAVSSPFEDGSDIGSPGVDGPPIMPEDPYAYIMAAYQVPPSPDYIPGPEEPQSPPPLDFVPEPMYPEYIPQEDEILPAEEQPLPAAASPTADSPGYVPESDPEEEPEEDDEDPEEDPADYPADRDDDDDDEDLQIPPR
ncbi:putative ribonuclease H-like domain-containing protein [Tanacetum coccineum]